jgi:hypothetical protein
MFEKPAAFDQLSSILLSPPTPIASWSTMGQQELILKRAARITPSCELKHDDYDVLCGDKMVGRIMKAAAAPVGRPWLWILGHGAHRDHPTTHGYAVDRDEAALQH